MKVWIPAGVYPVDSCFRRNDTRGRNDNYQLSNDRTLLSPTIDITYPPGQRCLRLVPPPLYPGYDLIPPHTRFYPCSPPFYPELTCGTMLRDTLNNPRSYYPVSIIMPSPQYLSSISHLCPYRRRPLSRLSPTHRGITPML